jgi:hypothetical protein
VKDFHRQKGTKPKVSGIKPDEKPSLQANFGQFFPKNEAKRPRFGIRKAPF